MRAAQGSLDLSRFYGGHGGSCSAQSLNQILCGGYAASQMGSYDQADFRSGLGRSECAGYEFNFNPSVVNAPANEAVAEDKRRGFHAPYFRDLVDRIVRHFGISPKTRFRRAFLAFVKEWRA